MEDQWVVSVEMDTIVHLRNKLVGILDLLARLNHNQQRGKGSSASF